MRHHDANLLIFVLGKEGRMPAITVIRLPGVYELFAFI